MHWYDAMTTVNRGRNSDLLYFNGIRIFSYVNECTFITRVSAV